MILQTCTCKGQTMQTDINSSISCHKVLSQTVILIALIGTSWSKNLRIVGKECIWMNFLFKRNFKMANSFDPITNMNCNKSCLPGLWKGSEEFILLPQRKRSHPYVYTMTKVKHHDWYTFISCLVAAKTPPLYQIEQ